MRDGSEDALRHRERAQLVYPFEKGPETGEAVDIAAGVKWLRMPLGGPLGFINVWALADADGWAVVDFGMGNEDTRHAWRAALDGPLGGKPVTRVFVTHMHPDHIGMSGYLTRKYRCRLWITRLEFVTCRSLAADTGHFAPEEAIQHYRAAGWDENAVETYRARFGQFGRGMHPLPDTFHRLKDGDEVRIGEHVWRVVVGSGHSPEHACFHCPELKLMITGDQVLPKISSNVSVYPMEPEGNPLEEWLTSLRSIRGRVPNDVLVLPAHNEPFHGLHHRIDHLIGGHERGLARMRRHLRQPRRVVDVFPMLFRRKIDENNLILATGESLAHLNYLLSRGEAVRERDAAGVDWYRAAA